MKVGDPLSRIVEFHILAWYGTGTWLVVWCYRAKRHDLTGTCVMDQLTRATTPEPGEEARNFGAAEVEEARRHYKVAGEYASGYFTASKRSLANS